MARVSRDDVARHADRVARALETDTITNIGVLLTEPTTFADLAVDADEDHLEGQAFHDHILGSPTLLPGDRDLLLEFARRTGGDLLGEDLIQVRRWARTRVVYAIDPTTADAVMTTDWSDTVIPGDVLARLPYPNPMVVLPTPIRFPHHENGHVTGVEKYDAFLVTGYRDRDRRRCSTTDPTLEGFRLHFLGRLVDPVTDRPIRETVVIDGRARSSVDVFGMRVAVTFADATMQERQDHAARILLDQTDRDRVGFADTDDAAAAARLLTAVGLSLLVYLASTDLDTRNHRVPASKPRTKSRGPVPSPGPDTTVIEVGYRVGAALRAAARPDDRSTAPGSGARTVAPHLRRAHIHRFWKGPRSDPGKRYQVLHWIPPTPVAWKGDPGTTQVHLP